MTKGVRARELMELMELMQDRRTAGELRAYAFFLAIASPRRFSHDQIFKSCGLVQDRPTAGEASYAHENPIRALRRIWS